MSSGKRLGLAEGWVAGETTSPLDDPHAVGEVLLGMVSRARNNADLSGNVR